MSQRSYKLTLLVEGPGERVLIVLFVVDTPSGKKTRSQGVVLVYSPTSLVRIRSHSVQKPLKLQKGNGSKIAKPNDEADVGPSKKRKKCIRPNDDDVGS
ncbi:hypothetical protein RND71_009699 [Anisodus tanguticus]|uniref:Uncharacterized protein n=1 Tax=Anisodus tanguticus TaxID=243964 RepID=A0AAE1VRG5_9SOLA|nr:hypothetical protein RND71_009699 [Anisodus tanguticus]